MRRLILFLAASLYTLFSIAQVVENSRILSFENKNDLKILNTKNSKVEVSPRHFRLGTNSLHWKYKANASVTLNKDLGFEPQDPTGKDTYLSAFIVWVYNEKPSNKQIRFEFLKDGKVCSYFPMNINFQGWRGVWVCYERDMQGKPCIGMNQMRIVAPDQSGDLYFDHLILASKVDARQQAADLQVPFVNAKTKNHWLQIYNNSLKKSQSPLTAVTKQQIKDIKQIEKRFKDLIYSPGQVNDKALQDIRTKYDKYNIVRNKDEITGTPIFFVRHAEAYERFLPNWDKDMFTKAGVELTAYFKLMNQIAICYLRAKDESVKKELANMFINMYDNITDQGVVYGSCWGNIHHYGYSMRLMFPTYYLMKDVLREHGKLKQAEETLLWYSQSKDLYDIPTTNGLDMDVFNTEIVGIMASILLMDNSPEKVALLHSFSRWLDYGCRPAPGLRDALKIDGCGYHHCRQYPAYAIGGLTGITEMTYVLSHTTFEIGREAHETIRKALLAMRFYCNMRSFPLAMSGRHPDGKGELMPIHYAFMAMVGGPDNRAAIDTVMAGAYLRLAEQKKAFVEKKIWKQLIAQGFQPESNPQGNMSLPYASASVQRRDQWAAIAVGHSRYLTAAEHYKGANIYGRYLTHGSLQLLTAPQGEIVTPKTSGWQEAGFDWTHIPGTTATILPLDKMKAILYNVDAFSGLEEMLMSDQTFSGGLSQRGQNGNFGMILHENAKYNGTLWAHKSVHFFDSLIVCLGSNIKNAVSDYPTETTIFQEVAATPTYQNYWNNYPQQQKVWMDPIGTGYYCPEGAVFRKKFPQYSRTQNTDKETKGNWVSLVVSHGLAPKNGQYNYAIIPNTTQAKMDAFAKAPTYQVLKQDSVAHIVRAKDLNMYSYVIWQPTTTILPGNLIESVDTPCMVMTKNNSSKAMYFTLAQPDLALYKGKSDDIYDKDGKWVERSIYSRPWIGNESQIVPVTITLKGKWSLKKQYENIKLVQKGNSTTIIVETKDGASYDIELINNN